MIRTEIEAVLLEVARDRVVDAVDAVLEREQHVEWRLAVLHIHQSIHRLLHIALV